jgi:hypothetical protein
MLVNQNRILDKNTYYLGDLMKRRIMVDPQSLAVDVGKGVLPSIIITVASPYPSGALYLQLIRNVLISGLQKRRLIMILCKLQLYVPFHPPETRVTIVQYEVCWKQNAPDITIFRIFITRCAG